MITAEKKQISVIIPVYNEAPSLELLAHNLAQVLNALGQSYEIIFVDDCSTDDSLSILKTLAAENQRLKVLSFRSNFGQTAAIAAGIDHSCGQIIIPLDADLQNDPADIPRLLDKINEGYDVVSGWRRHRSDNFLTRILPSIIANKIISIISGVHLHDYGCTLKAYRREVIKNIRLYGEMHRFIPIYAAWQGANVTELEVRHEPRQFGKSKYGFERTFKVILDLIVIKFLTNYAQKPIYIFGGFGIFCFLIAFLAGLYAVYLKYFRSISFIQTPLPLLTVLLTVLGFNSILLGLLAEISIRTYYESQNKPIYSIKEEINFSDAKSGDSP